MTKNSMNRTVPKMYSVWFQYKICVRQLSFNIQFVYHKDPHEDAPEIQIPGTPYKLRIMDNLVSREVRISNYNYKKILEKI